MIFGWLLLSVFYLLLGLLAFYSISFALGGVRSLFGRSPLGPLSLSAF
jgi:hypothetical protein